VTATPCVLAVDLGTSGVKVALVTMQGQILGHVHRPMTYELHGATAEQSPDDWWTALCEAARALLAQGHVPVEAVKAVSCTGQWSGTVPVDGEGRALAKAITWMDSRGAPYVRKLVGGLLEVDGYALHKALLWIHLTGGAPGLSGKDPIGHLLYLKAEQPELYRATHKFLEPVDYLGCRLSGRLVASYATITLHWLTDTRDIGRVTYSEALLRRAGIEREKLPDLVPAASLLGPITSAAARDLGLPEGVHIVVGAPDVHAAAIGSGAVRDYQAHVCLGTSSWLTCHLPWKGTSLKDKLGALPAAIPGRYLLTNEQESAAVCLAFLADNLLLADDELRTRSDAPDVYAAFNALAARAAPGSGGLLFTPWLNGERAPVDDHLVRGAFLNLSLQTTRAELVRAVLEGVAYNSRWLLQAVERFIRRPIATVNLIGGGARSAEWCQIYADVFGRPIRQMHEPLLAGARGAGLCGAVALGQLDFARVEQLVPVERAFAPNPDTRGLYDEMFREFVGAYSMTRKIGARLNRPHPAVATTAVTATATATARRSP